MNIFKIIVLRNSEAELVVKKWLVDNGFTFYDKKVTTPNGSLCIVSDGCDDFFREVIFGPKPEDVNPLLHGAHVMPITETMRMRM